FHVVSTIYFNLCMTYETLDFLDRYTSAQHGLGRAWLHLEFQLQRLRSSWLASGAEALKRGFDIIVSFLFLLLLAPLFAFIATAVWVEDGGSIFFAQTR